jgi:hypothetical protein
VIEIGLSCPGATDAADVVRQETRDVAGLVGLVVGIHFFHLNYGLILILEVLINPSVVVWYIFLSFYACDPLIALTARIFHGRNKLIFVDAYKWAEGLVRLVDRTIVRVRHTITDICLLRAGQRRLLPMQLIFTGRKRVAEKGRTEVATALDFRDVTAVGLCLLAAGLLSGVGCDLLTRLH